MFFSYAINPCLKQEIDSQKLVVSHNFCHAHIQKTICLVRYFPIKQKVSPSKPLFIQKKMEPYNHLSQWNRSGHDVKIIHDFIVI